MMRTSWVFLLSAFLFIAGCNTESAEDETYDEMTSQYDLYTVSSLWDAMAGSDDANGTYILLQDEVFDMDSEVVTLVNTGTDKTIDCTFDSGTGPSGIGEGDIVTIGGVCRFSTDDADYPYLESCDYFYVNEDR